MAKFTLIYNGTLIDGNGGHPVTDGAVLLEDNRIAAVGPLASIQIPDGAERIDAEGGTILPGLIDAHVHMMFEVRKLEAQLADPFSLQFYYAEQYMRRTLDAGITTVRDAGGTDLGVKTAVERGLIEGPRMQISITPLTITGGHGDSWTASGVDLTTPSYPGSPSGVCDGVEQVRQKVREILRSGADIIKVHATGGVLSPTDHPEFTQFSYDELRVMVEEAKFRRGLKVMAHAQGAEGIKNAVRAGIHSIEHGIYLDEEAIQLMLEHGTYLVPTLLAPLSVIEQAEATGSMPEYGVKKARESFEAHRDSIARAYRAGVKIAMGTDAGVMPHGTNLRELGLMCDIGMTPMESIVATTKVAAECMGWLDKVGTLEVGKLADVVVARTNVIEDIRSLENTNNIALVVKDGNVVKDILSTSAKAQADREDEQAQLV
ncbi:metal-dependent hydrolase family protein [Alicyclobacillus ferrooxydans]|uniref:Aryldialkylphosphatase n=1 Tax=Alicyclobacillus ferrooxydans TaxID=471514 RepID=A0A0P9EI42_9BACL|nr:amidohydrolase family protein [Alicyclobacillus ferrooxydans]KPV42409.1 aryldialkylphosphatase [Alicyclobacillus ferrooxydans]